MMAADPLQKQRKSRPGKPFEKGRSGNPKGRITGSRNRVTALAERLMAADAQKVVEAVLTAAQGGDMTAARIVLDRIAPIRKGRPVTFSLPKIETAADVDKAIGSIASAMADGTLTPDEAGSIAAVVELRRKSIETYEHEARIAALEERTSREPSRE